MTICRSLRVSWLSTIALALVLVLNSACSPRPETPPEGPWGQWNGFKQTYMSDDGRIVDLGSKDSRTVSEGQAYGLFLALVANDKPAFEKLLSWSQNNLADGDLSTKLPAWLWGRQGETWGVIDSNSASDADLWIAYTLLEAGRLWCRPDYERLGKGLASTILAKESAVIPGLGLSILPGQIGFAKQDGSYKLNPSYLPPFQMQRLATKLAGEPRWAEVYLSSQLLLLKAQNQGRYPDWVQWQPPAEIDLSEQGNYDAIRVYFWLALTPDSDPAVAALNAAIEPFLLKIKQRGEVPETWLALDPDRLADHGPVGFQYMLEPALRRVYGTQQSFLNLPPLPSETNADAWRDLGYYNSVLALFAQGWLSGRYSIGSTGELRLPFGSETLCD